MLAIILKSITLFFNEIDIMDKNEAILEMLVSNGQK